MRRYFVTAILVGLCILSTTSLKGQTAAELAPPTHPATVAQIREYLTLSNYVANAHKAMGQMIQTSRVTAAPYFPASFWDDMAKSLDEIDLVTPAVPAYQKYFSEEDMAATIAFYKSPAGQKFLAAQPFIASAAGEVLRSAGQKVGQEVFARHKDEIETLKKKFDGAAAGAGAPEAPQGHP